MWQKKRKERGPVEPMAKTHVGWVRDCAADCGAAEKPNRRRKVFRPHTLTRSHAPQSSSANRQSIRGPVLNRVARHVIVLLPRTSFLAPTLCLCSFFPFCWVLCFMVFVRVSRSFSLASCNNSFCFFVFWWGVWLSVMIFYFFSILWCCVIGWYPKRNF